MLKIKPQGFLTLTFLLMIALVPLFYLVTLPTPRPHSMIEGKVLKRFSLQGLGFKSALDEYQSGQKSKATRMMFKLIQARVLPIQFERAASDQFPFRDQFIQLTYAFGRTLNELAYWRSPLPAIPATILPDTGLKITRDKSILFYGPAAFTKETAAPIDIRIGNYLDLITRHPELNWYIYTIDTISNSAANPLDPYSMNPDRGQALQYFLDHKPAKLTVDHLVIQTFKDHIEYFYRTDGHWNIHGILQGYRQIHAMLSTNFPEISPVRAYEDIVTFPDIRFRGELRRQTMYPVEGDIFEVVDYDLPAHETYGDGEEITYGRYADYFSGNYSTEPFVNHYGQFFGRNYGQLEFIFDGQTDRDILIFGNSFDNPLVPLIAQHYHHTYSLDLLSYKNFSLEAFLANHPVDDVIVIGGSDICFQDPTRLINP